MGKLLWSALNKVLRRSAWERRRSSSEWREMIRREMLDYFAEHDPETKVIELGDNELRAGPKNEWPNWGKDQFTIYLDNTFDILSRLDPSDVEGRKEYYAKFVAMLAESRHVTTLHPDRDRPNILPRIMREEHVASYNATVTMPSRPFGLEGLSIAYVINQPSSVAYVGHKSLAELELTEDELFNAALSNLRKTWNLEGIRQTIEQRGIGLIKSGDTFDAARLLLVPECLHEGESIHALIPDLHTLVLLPVIDGHTWPAEMREPGEGDQPLCDRVIVVTPSGFAYLEEDANTED